MATTPRRFSSRIKSLGIPEPAETESSNTSKVASETSDDDDDDAEADGRSGRSSTKANSSSKVNIKWNWRPVKSFKDMQSAKAFVQSSNQWEQVRTSRTRKDDSKTDYVCKFERQCSARIYLAKNRSSTKVTMWSTGEEHDHADQKMGRRGGGGGESRGDTRRVRRSSSTTSKDSSKTTLVAPTGRTNTITTSTTPPQAQTAKRGRGSRGGSCSRKGEVRIQSSSNLYQDPSEEKRVSSPETVLSRPTGTGSRGGRSRGRGPQVQIAKRGRGSREASCSRKEETGIRASSDSPKDLPGEKDVASPETILFRPTTGTGSRGGRPRGRGGSSSRGLSTRGRGIPRARRGGVRGRSRNIPEFRYQELDDRYFVAGPANFVDGEVLGKLTSRINNGLNLINQSFVNLKQAEQELMITKAFLESIHDSTSRVTRQERDPGALYSNSIGGLHSTESLVEEYANVHGTGESSLLDVSGPVNLQMSLDPFDILEAQGEMQQRVQEGEDEPDQHQQLEHEEVSDYIEGPEVEMKASTHVTVGLESEERQRLRRAQLRTEEAATNSIHFDPPSDFDSICNLDDDVVPMDDDENTVVPPSALMQFQMIGDLMRNNDSRFSKTVSELELQKLSEVHGDKNTKKRNGAESESSSRRKRKAATYSETSSSSRNTKVDGPLIFPDGSSVKIESVQNSLSLDVRTINDCIPAVCLMDCRPLLQKWPLAKTRASTLAKRIQNIEESRRINDRITYQQTKSSPLVEKRNFKRGLSPSSENEAEGVDSMRKKLKVSKNEGDVLRQHDNKWTTNTSPSKKPASITELQPSPETRREIKEKYRLLKEQQQQQITRHAASTLEVKITPETDANREGTAIGISDRQAKSSEQVQKERQEATDEISTTPQDILAHTQGKRKQSSDLVKITNEQQSNKGETSKASQVLLSPENAKVSEQFKLQERLKDSYQLFKQQKEIETANKTTLKIVVAKEGEKQYGKENTSKRLKESFHLYKQQQQHNERGNGTGTTLKMAVAKDAEEGEKETSKGLKESFHLYTQQQQQTESVEDTTLKIPVAKYAEEGEKETGKEAKETPLEITAAKDVDGETQSGRGKDIPRKRLQHSPSAASVASTVDISFSKGIKSPLMKGIDINREHSHAFQTALNMFKKDKKLEQSEEGGVVDKAVSNIFQEVEEVQGKEVGRGVTCTSTMSSPCNKIMEVVDKENEAIGAVPVEPVGIPNVFFMDPKASFSSSVEETYEYDGEPELIIAMEEYEDFA